MELLPPGKKNNTEVSYEDQQKINEFSKLVLRKDTLVQDLEKERQEKEHLDDVTLELELVDEDELVKYKIGDVFMLLKQSEVMEQLEEDSMAVQSRIDTLEEQETEINSRLSTLKTELYAKFGDNINLERWEDGKDR